jgi:glucose/arabinose dehydrogenase
MLPMKAAAHTHATLRADRRGSPSLLRLSLVSLMAGALFALTACGEDDNAPPATPGGVASEPVVVVPPDPTPSTPEEPVVNPDARKVMVTSTSVTPATGTAPVKATVLADELKHPWSVAFLLDGRMLVTERSGKLLLVSTTGTETTLTPVSGVPQVFASGQGGLLDVQVDPGFSAGQPWIYFTFAEPGSGADAGKAGTAVARAKLVGDRLENLSVIFRQSPKVGGGNHFGSRLVFAKDGTLFVTLGERFQDSMTQPDAQYAQNLAKHLGKVVRINKDGTVPAGNPGWNVAGALPEIWSLGHRNPQGATLHPTTGELWVSEHGPQGGDEINVALAGRNFGWPLRSYGCPYGAEPADETCQIGGGKHAAAGFVEPVTTWVPKSTAPSGLTFYFGGKLPEWQGSLFSGALAGASLWRVTVNGHNFVSREELFRGTFGRIRDVRQGPDGWLYLLTDSDNGQLIRIER